MTPSASNGAGSSVNEDPRFRLTERQAGKKSLHLRTLESQNLHATSRYLLSLQQSEVPEDTDEANDDIDVLEV